MARYITCDLCGKMTDKPHGEPPKDWRSYRQKLTIDLCPECVKKLATYLGTM